MGLAAAELCEDAFGMARDDLESIIALLCSSEAGRMTHSDLEGLLRERGHDLLRKLLQAHVDSRGPGEAAAAVRGDDGVERTQERSHDRGLSTIFGDIRVKRLGYGAEGAGSLHPLDAELNLPREQYSFGLRRVAAEEVSKGSFDEAAASVNRYTGAEVGKRQVEELARRAAEDFDAFYLQRAACAEDSTPSVLVISADGKGVVMLRSDLRAATRKAAEKRPRRLDKRLTRGEKRNRKRMATVAAVYTVAPNVRQPDDVMRVLAPSDQREKHKRPRPQDKRVWASLAKEPEEVLAEAFAKSRAAGPLTPQELGRTGGRQQHPTADPPEAGDQAPCGAPDRAGLHPCLRIRVEGLARLLRTGRSRSRSVGSRTTAPNPVRRSQPGGRGYAPQRHPAKNQEEAAEECGSVC